MTEAVPEGVGGLRWRSHPAGERPVAAAALLVIMLAASAVAAWWGGSAWWGLVGFAMLVLAMWSFLLPCEYRMDDAGVSKRSVFGTETRTWREVRSFTVDRWGMLLSPFPRPTRLAKFRGVSLQFAPGNREEVVAFVRARFAGRSTG
jgi:hypothetical protein